MCRAVGNVSENTTMANRIGRSVVGAVAAAACLALAPTARAAVYYQSTFDPVNFSVNAIFEVDAPLGSSCLTGASGWVGANLYDSNGRPCTVSLISAVATLVDTDTNQSVFIPFVTYDDHDPMLTNIILGIYNDGGNPAGVAWFPALIGSETTLVPGNATLSGRWWLSFFNSDLTGPPFESTAYLWKEECKVVFGHTVCVPKPVAGDAGVAGQVTEQYPSGFQPLGNVRPLLAPDGSALAVPEPGSIALLLGAMSALWLTRRRKARA